MKVFLDDDRNHHSPEWLSVRTVPALFRLIAEQGNKIEAISFDNDLRQPEEGWEGVRDLIERRLDDASFLPALKAIYVHSLNGGAADRMISKLESAVAHGIFDITVERRPAYDGIYPLECEDPRDITVYE